MNENTTNTQQQPSDATPAAMEGQGGGKMFTQDDVNRIVSERLAREREKAAPDPIDEREKAIAAREAAISCKEYIAEKKYPAGLLEVFDTSDAERFKTQVDTLLKHFPDIDPAVGGKVPIAVKGTSTGTGSHDPIREAFRPK